MKIEKISIDKIKPYENNAKLHPPEQIEQIKKSIQDFGNNDPIAVDENSVIIEGHGRYQALKELGFKEIEVIRLTHLNEQQKKAYILAHNKLTMNTGFDFNMLSLELDSIDGFDMSDFGFEIDFEKENQRISENKEIDTNELHKILGIDISNMPDAYDIQFIKFVQVRKHKKRRINKKWLKRYDYKQTIIESKGWKMKTDTDGNIEFIK